MLSKKKKMITGVVVLAAILILGFWYFFQKDRITVPDTYQYDDLTEYVTLGNYKGIQYKKNVKKVSDSDVQSEVKKAIKKASTTKDVKSGTVGSDSKVKIDFTGKINGKKFDGGEYEIQEYGGVRKVNSHEAGEGKRNDGGEGCVFRGFCEDSEGQ